MKRIIVAVLKRRKRTQEPLRMQDYWRWLKPHRRGLGIVFLLALIAAALQMLEPLFLRFIVDRSLLAKQLDIATRIRRLNIAGITFLSVLTLSALVNVAKSYRQRLLNVRLTSSLRRSLYERLLALPLPKLWEMKTGGILSRLSGDVETATGLSQLAVLSPALAVVKLVFALTVLLSLNWRLALIAITALPGLVGISILFANRVRPIYRVLRNDAEAIDGRVAETFSGIRVVRAFRREAAERREYLRAQHGIVRKELFASRREITLWVAWGLMLSVVNVVIEWYGGWLTLLGRASVGDIMAFQWYTMLLVSPVLMIVNSFSEVQRSLASTERVFEVLRMPEDKPDRPHAMQAPGWVETLRFEEVEFEYREGCPVIRDFNVTVRGGALVALIGRSGAGKTTVTDLVARFHDPTRGRILLNGTDLRDFRLRSYRDLLAVVPQNVFLFDGSVRENIAYGRHDATEQEIVDAACRANADEFIMELPECYDTVIGERGVKLSGGQQQRLAIARAFVKKPHILILDEATSNLDSESERLIQESLSTLLSGRTTFVIAHRLSTVRRADLILVMDRGRIVEHGTHASLMNAAGAYHSMIMDQLEMAAYTDATILVP